jgi:hypothetical protein
VRPLEVAENASDVELIVGGGDRQVSLAFGAAALRGGGRPAGEEATLSLTTIELGGRGCGLI